METPLNSEDLRLKNGHGNVTDVSVPAIEITSIEPVYLKIETDPLPPDFDVKNPLVTASAVTLKSEKLDIKHESDSTSNLTCRICKKTFGVLRELNIHWITCALNDAKAEKDERDLTVIVDAPLASAKISEIVATASSLIEEGIEPGDGRRCIEWCAKHRLIANSTDCNRCGVPMEFRRRKCLDGFTWYCPNMACRTTISIRNGSFFSNAGIPLWKIIRLIHLWAMGTSLTAASRELKLRPENERYKDFREICTRYISDWSMPIGGEKEYVEIDAILCQNEVRKDKPVKLRYFGTTLGGVKKINYTEH